MNEQHGDEFYGAAERVLSERELAQRWSLSRRTLQRWRAAGSEPAWIVIGGSIRYRVGDVLAYEERQRRGEGAR